MRATLAGLAAAFLSVLLIESASHLIWPPPEGLIHLSHDDQVAAIARLPKGALLMVLGAWCAGILVGGEVARRLAGLSRIPAVVVTLSLLAAVVWMLASIPHPTWFLLASLLSLTACAFHSTRPPTPPRQVNDGS